MANDKVLVHSDYRDDPLKLLDRAHMDYVPWLDAMHQVHRGQDAPDIPITRTGQVEALINSGRCLWVCPACNSVTPVENRPSTTPVGNTGTGATWDLTPTPAHYGHPSICVQCGSDWVDVIFPTNLADIEAELMKQPGHRGFAPVRNWQPGWTIEYLEERTARANVLIAAGVNFVRALSIGTPRLWSVGEILTASNMNTYISDILDDLKGTNGPIEYTDAIVIDSLTTTGRNALTAMNGMLIYNSTLNVFQRYENGAWVDHTHANTLTLASGAQGDVLFLNSSGTVTRLTAGTDRQVFRTQGASANPIWDDLEDIRVAGTTARGEIVFIGSNGRLNRLAAGANRQALRTRGSDADPTFADLEDLRVAGTTARGDVFYVGSNGRLNRLAAGTSNFFFQTKGASADPIWAAGSVTVTFVRLTTGTSWTVPTAANAVYVEVIGGGGGGDGGTVGTYRLPGEGGLTARHFFLASSLGTTVAYAIGAGGAAATAGGNTVFAGHAVGLGGRGGIASTALNDRPEATGQSGANGGFGGSFAATGNGGRTGLPTTVSGGAGGTVGTGTGNGGAGGAGTNSLDGLGSGGGGGGGSGGTSGNGGVGGAGGIPGGGGGGGGTFGGSATQGAGGAGGRGEIRIWYW